MPNYWMLVTTPENYQITENLRFTIQGVKTKQRKKAQRMQQGDRMLYYVKFIKKFPAIATITSTCWEDHEVVWKAERGAEDFPYRVQIKPDIVLDEADYLDAYQLGPGLQYVRRWVPEDWYLAFQEPLHLLPQRDFSLIYEEMRKIVQPNTAPVARALRYPNKTKR